MTKKKMVSGIFAALTLILLGCFTPRVVFGAEMDNQVGIQFENDYTPSSKEPIPGGQTPVEPTPPPVAKPAGGGKGILPSTGEQATFGLSVLGILVLVGGISFMYRKRDTHN